MALGSRPSCSATTATSRGSSSPSVGASAAASDCIRPACPTPTAEERSALLAGLDRASPQLRVPGLVLLAGHSGRVDLSVRRSRRGRWGRQVVDLVAGHLEVE